MCKKEAIIKNLILRIDTLILLRKSVNVNTLKLNDSQIYVKQMTFREMKKP